jgi:hypothetical protein
MYAVFAAAGIAAGLVYWVIAGRKAGDWRPCHVAPQTTKSQALNR